MPDLVRPFTPDTPPPPVTLPAVDVDGREVTFVISLADLAGAVEEEAA